MCFLLWNCLMSVFCAQICCNDEGWEQVSNYHSHICRFLDMWEHQPTERTNVDQKWNEPNRILVTKFATKISFFSRIANNSHSPKCVSPNNRMQNIGYIFASNHFQVHQLLYIQTIDSLQNIWRYRTHTHFPNGLKDHTFTKNLNTLSHCVPFSNRPSK